jgi:hypothetical protein
MDTGAWITSTVSVLALAVSVVALLIALRSAHTPRSAASASADPVVPVEPAEAPAEEPAAPVGVVWKIEHDAGITWRLRNIGTEPAFDVNAVGLPAESASLVKLAQSFADVPANGSLGFHVVRTAHHPNVRGLAITWAGQEQPVTVTME